MKNEALYHSSFEFVKKAIQIMSNFAKKNNITPIEWISIPTNMTQSIYEIFDALSAYRYDVEKLYAVNLEEIEETGEFRNLIDLVNKDKVINEHFDKKIIINSYDPNISLNANYLLKQMTKITLWRNGSFGHGETIFNSVYHEIMNFFHSNCLVNSMLIGLEGFYCDFTEIELEQNIHVVEYPTWRLLNIWFNESRTWKHALIDIMQMTLFAVRVTWHDKKYVDKKIISITPSPSISKASQLESAAHYLISALKVFKRGSIGNGAVLPGLYFTDLVLDDAIMLPAMHTMNSYSLLKSDLNEFILLWRNYNRIHSKKPFNTAIKRFNYSFERWHDLEDKIIDYLIAFESLFLSDTGKGAYRGEKRFRLALRIRFFLSPNDTIKRKKIFQEMKTAYDIRSAIVHGGDTNNKLKSLKMNLSDFCDLIEGYLRNCIKSLIGNGKIPNWDDLIMEHKS